MGPKGCYRSRRCPPWVTTLAQAELYGLYSAAKIAAYEGHGTACIGVDSDTARYQALRQRATTHCHVQNRVLRRLSRLRFWSGLKLVFFGVHTSQNPADPLSRQSSFPSVVAAIKEAQARHTHTGVLQMSRMSTCSPYTFAVVPACLSPPPPASSVLLSCAPRVLSRWTGAPVATGIQFLSGFLNPVGRRVSVVCPPPPTPSRTGLVYTVAFLGRAQSAPP